ncbi:hypothetical protein FISHEDRAFT_57480 [Fistulina hepatica ATCC 64428]|uniref:Uncharacterized protein n=1 Tax=Fistulina hepatica ATCC 64428 TaxID=1128425 RepID=A0A0D7AHB8_9AGAR|nr:hypothetical protein FISHEDRAFT_57480 [Fistulina hepatica ATCC 64428]
MGKVQTKGKEKARADDVEVGDSKDGKGDSSGLLNQEQAADHQEEQVSENDLEFIDNHCEVADSDDSDDSKYEPHSGFASCKASAAAAPPSMLPASFRSPPIPLIRLLR